MDARDRAHPLGGVTVSGQATPVPESLLARTVFASLGGIVEIAAVNATGTWRLADVSVGGFLAARSGEMARLLDGIRAVGRFGAPAMAIADELGYLREHPVTSASLLLWSGAVTGVPQPLGRLEEPEVVRRMCRMGADLQSTCFLEALTAAAITARVEPGEGAERIADLLRTACDLADATGRSSAETVFRMWRVARLPATLRLGSGAPEWGKAGYRAYDERLERLLAPWV
ncbi:hypothetical protein GCM10023335_63050 [Streptomyces siamensis]|uniref:Uncharacterized protein n=1 Tax=Streptomyces siamensis TaxID=1274986 RepID=A0ABP9JD32_9ACTN